MRSDRTRAIGEIRPSQLVHTFGVGATVELPGLTALILGLDDWPKGYTQVLTEERLLNAVRREHGLEAVSELRNAPAADRDGGAGASRLPVVPFPRWLRCPRCKMLAPIENGVFRLETNSYRPELNRYVHDCPGRRADGSRGSGRGAPVTVLPARYMLACERGHLDDFPWDLFVHGGEPCSRGGGILELGERALATSAADITATCRGCGTSRPLSVAFGERAKQSLPGRCRGRHPHVDRIDDCDARPSTLVLGASNAWFAHSLSVVEIPQETDEVALEVEAHWAELHDVETPKELRLSMQGNAGLAALSTLVEARGAGGVLAAIEERRAGDDGESAAADLKVPEWEAFAQPASVASTADFELREVAVPSTYRAHVASVVQVHRLREVVALTGFSRLDAGGPVAPVSRDPPTWIPCAETRGEGVFLRFPEDGVAAWERQYAGAGRTARMEHAWDDWRKRRNQPPAEWPGERFVLLHSLAHALLREMALDSGYGAASIRERIYATGPGTPAMAGILLYTAAPDSEGTLGGLVALGDPDRLGPLLDRALDRMRLCSADPLCSEHAAGQADSAVHDAACHACQFVAETSCEAGNRFLDRSTLSPTFADPAGRIAYFGS